MQAYGDQLLTHALTMQQQKQCTLPPFLKITPSLSVSSPPLSPPLSAESLKSSRSTLKRKRDDYDETDTKSVKESKVSLDQALISASKTKSTTLLCNKLYTSYHNHHRLDTMLSSYTHDC